MGLRLRSTTTTSGAMSSFTRKTNRIGVSSSNACAPDATNATNATPGPGSGAAESRAAPTPTTITTTTAGTRPSPTGGPHLISSGCADLDKVLGGGLPLGTLTLFSQDGWTRHDEAFLKYVVSEAVAVGQSVGVVRHANDRYADMKSLLMRRMSEAEAMKEAATERAAQDAARNETKLRIAWQYEKYAKKDASSASQAPNSFAPTTSRPALGKHVASARGAWCHDHDISKPPSDEELREMLHPASRSSSDLKTYTIDGAQRGVVAGIVEAVRAFSAAVNAKGPGTVGRLVIPCLGGVVWGMEPDAVFNALVYIRSLVQDARPNIAVVVSVPPMESMRPSDAARIQHASDGCFKLTAVDDRSSVVNLSADRNSVCGVMEIVRLPGSFGGIRSPMPEVRSYVIRNKRKRLALEMFAVDPDAEASGSFLGSSGDGAVATASLEW